MGERSQAPRLRGRRRCRLAESLADVLDESLDDLRAERDPRRAVIRAYARLERVLAAHGIPRRPSDAPLEYLNRVLLGLSVSTESVQRLTPLFERAKFSHHDVGPEMKDEAIAALQTMQDELRTAEALARQERERAARARDRGRAGSAVIRALKLARLPIAATIVMAVALLALPRPQELVLDVYVLVLGGFVLAVLVSAVRRANPVATSSPFERALRRTTRAASDCPTSNESSAS